MTVDRAYSEKKKKNYHKHLEKSNYNSTGKKSRGKLLELCVQVKQKLASVRKWSKLQRLIHHYLAPSERSRLQARNLSSVCRSFMEHLHQQKTKSSYLYFKYKKKNVATIILRTILRKLLTEGYNHNLIPLCPHNYNLLLSSLIHKAGYIFDIRRAQYWLSSVCWVL